MCNPIGGGGRVTLLPRCTESYPLPSPDPHAHVHAHARPAFALTPAAPWMHVLGLFVGAAAVRKIVAFEDAQVDAFHIRLERAAKAVRSEEHTSELQSLMRTSYA